VSGSGPVEQADKVMSKMVKTNGIFKLCFIPCFLSLKELKTRLPWELCIEIGKGERAFLMKGVKGSRFEG
jgi:hypothetical protein